MWLALREIQQALGLRRTDCCVRVRVMWRRSVILVCVLLGACGNGAGPHCSGVEVKDPGRSRPVDIAGGIGYRAAPPADDSGLPGGPLPGPGLNPDSIETVDGQPVSITGETAIIGGSCFSPSGCNGLVLLGQDGRTARQIIILEEDQDPEEVTYQTHFFRFEDRQVVIDGGATLDLASDVEIRCGVDEVTPAQMLENASFGVDFRIDRVTSEVVGASCVGCE